MVLFVPSFGTGLTFFEYFQTQKYQSQLNDFLGRCARTHLINVRFSFSERKACLN